MERTVIHDNAFLGAGVRLDGCVLGRSCDLRQGVRCEEGVVLGDESFVGAHAVIKSGVKVYPFKTVEAGATVNTSIVWESRGARTLFGRLGITGLANVDISPELVMRLSMAWASTLEKGSTITASRDTSRAARVLKRAMIVGCNAAGVNVEDLEVATVPVTRFQVRSGRSLGGITVRLFEQDTQSVMIRFFDQDGIDIAEPGQRKIERLYHREEFRRALASEIGDIGYAPRALELYTAALSDTVDVEAIARAGFKMVLDYSFGTASFVMPNVLAKLGAEVLVVNPYAATAAVMASDPRAAAGRVADLVRASGAHLGAVIDPGGENITLVDDEGKVFSDNQTLLLLLDLVVSPSPARQGGAPGVDAHGGRAHLRRGRGRDHVDQAVGHPPDGGGQHRAGSPSRPARWAASSSRASSPPSTAWPPSCTCWACWPAPTSACRSWRAGCRPSTSSTRRSSRPGSRRAR